jgi:hypothetical protein
MKGECNWQPGVNAHAAQRGVVAKRRLPSGSHTRPTDYPAATYGEADHLGDVGGRIPAIDKADTLAGKLAAALSPDKNPFDTGSLATVAGNANSRFFTDCYHQAAAMQPPGRRESAAGGVLVRTLGRSQPGRGGVPPVDNYAFYSNS